MLISLDAFFSDCASQCWPWFHKTLYRLMPGNLSPMDNWMHHVLMKLSTETCLS